MNFENLLVEVKQEIAYITINREAKLNALNLKTVQELEQVVDYINANAAIKVAILTGAGQKSFVAGADISEIAQLSVEQSKQFALNGQRIFDKIENSPKPIIAAVNGFALGGGCELAMACHFRVASENAKFGQPEVNLGIIPGYGGTQRLTMLVGKGKAMELMMTGNLISAQEAKTLGLVNYVVPQEELMATVEKIISAILKKGPIAIAQVIEAVNAFYKKSDGYLAEAEAFAACCATQDFKEGTSAFLEKREAKFEGK